MTISHWLEQSALTPNISSKIVFAICNPKTTLDALSWVSAHGQDKVTDEQHRLFDQAQNRYLNHEPLDYIIGYSYFKNLKLFVDKRVLIPRPETEELVDLLTDDIARNNHTSLTIAEIGTGSGAISLALTDWLEHQKIRSTIIATDISKDALEVAKTNASHIPRDFVHLDFRYGSLLEPIQNNEKTTYIIANLPYIPSEEIQKLEKNVIDFEPHLALDGGEDGFEIIRALLADAQRILLPGGKIFLETWYEHTTQHVTEYPHYSWSQLPDSFGRNRFLIGTRTK